MNDKTKAKEISAAHRKLPMSELESAAIRQHLAANGLETPLQKCDVRIINRRTRLLDEGNLLTKHHFDRLTEIGVLSDDSKKYINSITTTQEKVKTNEEESLIIEFIFL